MSRNRRLAQCLLPILMLGAGSARAGPIFSFEGITNNKTADTQIGEAQLSVELIDLGGTFIGFEVGNSGPWASIVTEIVYDRDFLKPDDPSCVADFSDFYYPSDGLVKFMIEKESQWNLPGGNEVGFDPDFGVIRAKRDGVANGINPGERLGLIFLLADGCTFEDVLYEMQFGDLRLGLHVQGFDGGGSESFMSNTPIPLPAAAAMAGSILAAGAFSRRRRSW